MTTKGIVDEMADAMACAEGEHRVWREDAATDTRLPRWRCVACGYAPSDGSGAR